MNNYLDRIIYLIVYLGIMVGTWLLLYPIISPFFNKRKITTRFRGYKHEKSFNTRHNKIIRHLEMLLSVTLHIRTNYALFSFLFISSLLFILSFIFLYQTGGGLVVILFISSSIGLAPYVFLQMKLHKIRIGSSYEAEFLLTELINQYKINYLNMMEAIDVTIPSLSKQPHSKWALTKLSLAVKQYRNSEDLERIIQEFNFAINTGWAILLANNIYLAIEYGDDVTESLTDLLNDLIVLKVINEKNKQYNHETFMMIKYIAPASYLISIYAMYSIFGFTTTKFIEYQFKSAIGFKFFLLTIMFISINFVIYFFINKPKNDF